MKNCPFKTWFGGKLWNLSLYYLIWREVMKTVPLIPDLEESYEEAVQSDYGKAPAK